MSNQTIGGDGGVSSTETLLKERFAQDLATVHPDVSLLVDGGSEAGRRLRRRRRLTTGVGAAVATAVMGAAWYAATGTGLLGDDAAPANPSFEQLVESTPRGMAAAVIAHLPDGYERAAGRLDESGDVPLVVALGIPEETRAELQVMASPEVDAWAHYRAEACSAGHCEVRTTPEGTEVVTVTASPAGSGANILGAFANQGDDVVIAVLSAPEGMAPLPLTAEELVAIVTDPLVGMQTTAEMNTSGEALENWSGEYPFESNGSDRATGSAVEVDPAPSTAEGEGRGSGPEESSPN
jgi:hypothetical protein